MYMRARMYTQIHIDTNIYAYANTLIGDPEGSLRAAVLGRNIEQEGSTKKVKCNA